MQAKIQFGSGLTQCVHQDMHLARYVYQASKIQALQKNKFTPAGMLPLYQLFEEK